MASPANVAQRDLQVLPERTVCTEKMASQASAGSPVLQERMGFPEKTGNRA
jgi:hypothetical protein